MYLFLFIGNSDRQGPFKKLYSGLLIWLDNHINVYKMLYLEPTIMKEIASVVLIIHVFLNIMHIWVILATY